MLARESSMACGCALLRRAGRVAWGLGIRMLHRHPAVDHGTGAARAAEMLDAWSVRLFRLPARELNQRLIVAGILALKAVHPGEPPISVNAFLVTAYIAGIALADRHGLP